MNDYLVSSWFPCWKFGSVLRVSLLRSWPPVDASSAVCCWRRVHISTHVPCIAFTVFDLCTNEISFRACSFSAPADSNAFPLIPDKSLNLKVICVDPRRLCIWSSNGNLNWVETSLKVFAQSKCSMISATGFNIWIESNRYRKSSIFWFIDIQFKQTDKAIY